MLATCVVPITYTACEQAVPPNILAVTEHSKTKKMSITTVRKISQAFFLALFLILCIVASPGQQWWELRGWPVNWFIQLDPLVAISTALATGALYAGLIWALVSVVMTIVLGRFFCGWVCPMGSAQHLVGYLAKRAKPPATQIKLNRYHRWQYAKYYILAFMLAAAGGNLLNDLVGVSQGGRTLAMLIAGHLLMVGIIAVARKTASPLARTLAVVVIVLGGWVLLGMFFPLERVLPVSLQIGLLDPLVLMHRAVNLVLLPIVDTGIETISPTHRYYQWAWAIGAIFGAAVLLCIVVPRFYCRFVCPLGALFGLLGRFAIWRVGRKDKDDQCTGCGLCEVACEGACNPAGKIRISECVLCMNCLHTCNHHLVKYQTAKSTGGEITGPDISRRGVMLSIVSGLLAIPMLRLSGKAASNWSHKVIRPPGSMGEADFLARCIKCGQCMRVCPTNVIQPAGLEGGFEGLWTPALNNRIGSSGCQLNCVDCGNICPTGAIRKISLDEKLGRGQFTEAGPIRIGTAFVDRGRCMPWAMDRPCIVCEENCPVSPKAILVRELFSTVREGGFTVTNADSTGVEVAGITLEPDQFATGDYYCKPVTAPGQHRRRIIAQSDNRITIVPSTPWISTPAKGSRIEVQIRLQQPYIDVSKCIGCGVCEHECPVSGKRAIRVTADNESRSIERSFVI